MSRTAVGSFLFVGDRPVLSRVDGPDETPPIVLVHGFSCSLHWYDDLVAELSADFRLIRIDLHGHGCTGGLTRVVLVGQEPAYGPGCSRLPRAGAVMALPIVGQVQHRFAPPVMVRQSLRIAFAGRYRAARHCRTRASPTTGR